MIYFVGILFWVTVLVGVDVSVTLSQTSHQLS